MADLQRQQARKTRGSIRYKRLGRQVAKLHERIGNLRREFLHQTTSRMVASCAVLATEELRTQNMSRSARVTQDKPRAIASRDLHSKHLSPIEFIESGLESLVLYADLGGFVSAQ